MTSQVTEVELEGLLHKALHATGTGARWAADSDGMWCRVTPGSGTRREQGWKLHVSATTVSAPAVLEKALEVLLREESAFKFARSLDQVSALNSRATPRGSSGKFITVYPRSDAEAARLAHELHGATAGLAGPRILSDQPYAVHSLVHYRYGSFVGRRRLSEDGLLVWFIEDPDGNPVEDKRTGRYSPPSWAVCPFPATVPVVPRAAEGADAADGADGAAAASAPVLLGGRFAVREAIRHTNKGGVYRGSDVRTGALVVIKEARPHVEADASGCDVRDWLRAEARTLEKLKGTGLAPEPLALFEHGGHLFLAQEEVPGVTLRTWVAEHFRDVGAERYRADAPAQVGRLVDLVAAAHARGCVLRDFTPGNVMVRPDGELRLIDLELAVLDDEAALPTRVGTPGFSAPERLADAPVSPTGDYYSLGATVCLVLAGKVPNLLPEEPATRATEQRLAAWLTACLGPLRLPDGLAEMVLGLMKDDPAERWDPARAREALRKAEPSRPRSRFIPRTPLSDRRGDGHDESRADSPSDAPHDAVTGTVDHAVTGIVEHLIDSMTPTDEHRLWPVSTLAGESDPCTVQQGAAGVLAVLTRYWELTGDDRLPELISTAGHWIADRTDVRSPRPGLHFGGRGTAWALYDAGRAVDDQGLMDHASALALAPQQATPHHDITHGSAGSGLAAVHLWQRTGDPRFAELVVDAADRLVAAARRDPSGVGWPVPAEAASSEGGKRYLGFAHGSAGIGCFLLAAATVSQHPQHRDLAVEVGEHLLGDAVLTGETAQWPAQAEDLPTAPYWCHGAAGIGTFLVRLWQATGDDRFGDLARRSTYAVTERASRAALAQCHGLAGNGDFLLDMADATGDPVHRTMAEDLARLIVSERAHRHAQVVFPNEYGDVSTSWSDGSAGILAFLLRIRHADPRHWMVRLPV
ncbi:class IV lanthionine synthetase LanL [Streptomyces sp. NBC_00233]|uniref:class IV lanthionine synthetase LanL n=1 Tax=Streptomyces sp. NBC_00233 TaxID=2975686 RepID=UPI002250226D|nr:class IV lanthionine synthetase LanL [Streptomyces sp. NBC_00233]MCX5231126.1 class IV lanthionine synthetase LanL [Streptomyces sp. NBC_00233]